MQLSIISLFSSEGGLLTNTHKIGVTQSANLAVADTRRRLAGGEFTVVEDSTLLTRYQGVF